MIIRIIVHFMDSTTKELHFSSKRQAKGTLDALRYCINYPGMTYDGKPVERFEEVIENKPMSRGSSYGKDHPYYIGCSINEDQNKAINNAIEFGYAKSRGDFARQAIQFYIDYMNEGEGRRK